MDLSKLDDEQIKVALKVIDSAKKYGINPDFVLPMVNAESGFRPDAHSGKAIGPMQLTPATAKDLKVDPHNVDENIDGGMRFLKGLIENKKLGGDSHNIFAAYNAGPNAKFFETGDLKDLPDETVSHVVKVMGSYGGEVPQMTITPAKQEQKPPEPPSEPSGVGENKPISERKPSKLEESLALGTAGAIAGGGTGALKEPIVGGWNWLTQRNAAQPTVEPQTSSQWPGAQTAKPIAPAQTVSAQTVQVPIVDESQPYKQVTATGDTESMSGRERQAGYTEKTGQIAARRKAQEQIAKELGLDVNRPLAGYGDVASTRSGVVVTQKSLEEQQAHERKLIEDAQRKAREAKQAKTTSSVAAAKKAGEQWAQVQAALKSEDPAVFAWGQKMLRTMRATLSEPWYRLGARLGFGAGAAIPYSIDLAREGHTKSAAALPVAAGALGVFAPRVMPAGLAAAAGISDVAQRAREGRTGEAAASGLSTAAATAAPFVGAGLNVMGLPVTAGVPLYLAASDRLRYLQEHPEEYRVEESKYDPLGMPIR